MADVTQPTLFTPERPPSWHAEHRAQFPPTDWRSVWGHACETCGWDCASTDHHVTCCGTETQHRTVGTYCTGHPCRGCHERADAILREHGDPDYDATPVKRLADLIAEGVRLP
jgi:hypothetical protein